MRYVFLVALIFLIVLPAVSQYRQLKNYGNATTAWDTTTVATVLTSVTLTIRNDSSTDTLSYSVNTSQAAAATYYLKPGEWISKKLLLTKVYTKGSSSAVYRRIEIDY